LAIALQRSWSKCIDRVRLILPLCLQRLRQRASNRNSYQPNWEYFRALEKAYKERRRQHANRYMKQDLSPSGCQESHSSDVNIGTQTCPTNTIPQTYKPCPSNLQHSDLNGEGLGNKSTANTSARAHPTFRELPSSKEAARYSAERRWNKNLLDRFRHTSMYATILEALDLDLQAAATQVEMERVGAGAPYILQELLKRKVLSSTDC
jgi:hypothetical protein